MAHAADDGDRIARGPLGSGTLESFLVAGTVRVNNPDAGHNQQHCQHKRNALP
ncbi:MAG: hypothetical protein ACOH2S_01555 [Janthinobacterium svalbardensis]